MPDYNVRVYNKVTQELRGVDWDNCPYNIMDCMTDTMERYFPKLSRDEIYHAVHWAVSNELGGGCEIETY